MANEDTDNRRALRRSTRYYIIWTVSFGVVLALGGSVLEPFPIPGLNFTAASPLVALMITLNKLVVRRPFSVTLMYVVVVMIAAFTGYLGPPSPLKVVFILAGLSFDAATLFRTRNLRLWNLLVGHLVVTVTGFTAFWFVFSVHFPESEMLLGEILKVVGPFYYLMSAAVATLVWVALRPLNPPAYLRRIWDQLSDNDEKS